MLENVGVECKVKFVKILFALLGFCISVYYFLALMIKVLNLCIQVNSSLSLSEFRPYYVFGHFDILKGDFISSTMAVNALLQWSFVVPDPKQITLKPPSFSLDWMVNNRGFYHLCPVFAPNMLTKLTLLNIYCVCIIIYMFFFICSSI